MIKPVYSFLKDKGYNIEETMSTHIAVWKSWYAGNVQGFHDYKVFNGQQDIKVKRLSLQLGKSICENIANLLFNEKCKIAIEDKTTDEFIKQVFDRNNMYVKLNESQERKAAYGTMAYIPYHTSVGIKMNYITSENMVPLSWENGEILELCVFSTVIIKGKEGSYVQLFLLAEDGTYNIENHLLSLDGDKVLSLQLDGVPGFEDVEPEIATGSKLKPFVIDRLNIANNIDTDSPLGVSVFNSALDVMRACDLIFDSYANEYSLGKKRVMVAAEATNVRTGQPVFDPDDLVFYMLPEGLDSAGKPYIQELNMSLRSAEHEAGLQQMLNIFSSQCGLGESFYRYSGSGALVTATQVISDNSTLFRTLKKHEIILESVLVDLIRLIVDIAIRNGEKALAIPEVTVIFDDSIIEDKEKEITRRMAEIAAGLLKPEKYIAWRYGVTEEAAKDFLPDSQNGTAEEGIQ